MIIGFESNKIILRTTQRKLLESIRSKDTYGFFLISNLIYIEFGESLIKIKLRCNGENPD